MHSPQTKFERVNTIVYPDSIQASKAVADEIVSLIKSKAAIHEDCVLGLATGSTPLHLYKELIRLHKEEGLSFANVVTFNLDEYYPVDPGALQSYVRFMHENLFDHIDIPKSQIHIPNGTLAKADVPAFCAKYERKIASYGGIDLQILGIGRSGHIGFNEPGSGANSLTRLISLDFMTVLDAASEFFGEENVPKNAITMGIKTILSAKRIVLMGWGEGKSKIIQKAIETPINDGLPATYLQGHPNTSFILDEAAASGLTRIKTPWLVDACVWDKPLIKKAVIWLSSKIQKPILKLTNRDYAEYGMGDIITASGNAYTINIEVFNELQHTITGWPGGKPNADDTHRPERAEPAQKRVIIFSPHPDDDVISMGGTFIRLVDQGHEVHVAYQTSGNIAVFDEDVIRFADFIRDFHDTFKLDKERANTMYHEIQDQLHSKKPGQIDTREVQMIKGLIRRAEAKAGCRYVGISDEHAHFLDLPFYETGLVKKKPLGPEDIRITKDLLMDIKPQQVYAAGDLSDPHGTHRVCLHAVIQSLKELKRDKVSWIDDCWLWLYRGAWQEWEMENIDMAIPISPEELMRKRKAIFKHQSQKDRPLFPGSDAREFWQRAEDRNRGTAIAYNQLGLAEYEAIEAFKRYFY
ncbi:MAG: glucosamine-6-phosphate deaminase [Saprospiraceae bacterium]